jgi:uncharacterized protein YjhX (UPF0386 family)
MFVPCLLTDVPLIIEKKTRYTRDSAVNAPREVAAHKRLNNKRLISSVN